MSQLPTPGSVWSHTNGNRYTVMCIANEFTERPEQYPQTVVYQGENGRIWSRHVSDWARSMTLVSLSPAPLLSQEERDALGAIATSLETSRG